VAARLPDGNQELVAYLAVNPDRHVTTEAVRGRLSAQLPEHMVPHRFVLLDRLPRTLTGKVDRLALPTRESERPKLETNFVAPRTPVEIALAAIWREVLAIDVVGIHDRFLDLGGDSLRATQILARVVDRIGVALEHRVLLQTPTIAEMAIAITQRQAGQLDAGELERMLRELEGAPVVRG